jgi:D-amino peptidase
MKILIAADMEGVTGVVHWDQVTTSHPEYTRFRRLMTGDVNAAIRGAYEGGASEVIVTDGHSYGRNILIEELDPRARLNSGTPSPLSMVQGVDSGVAGVFFVGYHARIGTQNAILEHTWSDERVANVWINGEMFGEIGLNAAVSGHFGVPVILISGDQAACAEAAALLGPLETVVVKQATGRFSAECLPPTVTQEMIQAGARQAVARLKAGKSPQPLHVATPVHLALDFVQSEMADKAAVLPGAQRKGRRLEYSASDMPALYEAFRAALGLARG